VNELHHGYCTILFGAIVVSLGYDGGAKVEPVAAHFAAAHLSLPDYFLKEDCLALAQLEGQQNGPK
jgi:hypothetical protein